MDVRQRQAEFGMAGKDDVVENRRRDAVESQTRHARGDPVPEIADVLVPVENYPAVFACDGTTLRSNRPSLHA